MTQALAVLIADPGPAATAGWVVVWLALSALLGAPLKRAWPERAAFGFLMLAGGADLALFSLRALNASTQWLGPLALGYAGLESLVLSRLVLNRPAATLRWHPISVVMLALTLAAAWTVRIVQVEPSSGLSSHLGWVPQYVLASFRAGHFLQPAELAAGSGMMEAVSFVADALGLTALAGWAGAEAVYPAYHAASIAAAALAVVVVARHFAARPLAMAAFLGLGVALALVDLQFRTVLLRHWGDTFILLGGALMLAALAGYDAEDAWKAAAAAATFLVFSRHYALLYGVLMVVLGWALVAVRGRRSWWPWVAVGVLLCVNGAREVWCVLVPPSPWYPGSKLVATLPSGLSYWIEATLNDVGVLTENRFSPMAALLRMAYLPALVALLLVARRRWGMARPALMLALPFVLEIVIGYRTPSSLNKLLILIALLPAFLPAWALLHAGWQPRATLPPLPRRRWLAATGLAVLAVGLTVAGPALTRMRELYRAKNTDYQMGAALRAAFGERMSEIAARPVLYIRFEPGLGLRNFIGGDIRGDLDWQGDSVLDRIDETVTMAELLARLGYPNIYVSTPHPGYPGFDRPGRDRLEAELHAATGKDWLATAVTAGDAQFLVPRRP